MAKRKEIATVHPLAATEALVGYHNDVSVLVTAVYMAIAMMENHDPAAACAACVPKLKEATARVDRWYR